MFMHFTRITAKFSMLLKTISQQVLILYCLPDFKFCSAALTLQCLISLHYVVDKILQPQWCRACILSILSQYSVLYLIYCCIINHMSRGDLVSRQNFVMPVTNFLSLSYPQTDNFPTEPNYMGSRQQFVQR